MVRRLVSLCRLDQLPEGRPARMVAPDGRVLVCVRRGKSVDALDDRCPHEGHPLSLGSVREGRITCAWHNWQFALDSGDCVQGEEGTVRFETEVHHDEVFIDLAPDTAAQVERATRDLVRALRRGSLDGAARDALRLDALTGTPSRARHEMLGLAAARDPEGLGEVLSVAHAAQDLLRDKVIDVAEAHCLLASAVIARCAGRPVRPTPAAQPSSLEDLEGFFTALLEDRRRDAEAMVRGLPAAVTAAQVARAWLLPFASLKLWDLGAALPRVAALVALSSEVPSGLGRELAAALTASLGTAYAPSDLPAWSSTRRAVLQVRAIPRGHGPLRDARFTHDEVLVSEAQAAHAALLALSEGTAPEALLACLGDAACVRLQGFVPMARGAVAREALEAGQVLTFLDAARALATPTEPWVMAHAVLAAGFLGKLRRHDAGDLPGGEARGTGLNLEAALEAREGQAARAAAAAPGASESLSALRAVVRFGALRARGEGAHGAPLAAALWRDAGGDATRAAQRVRAGVRIFLEAAPPDLAGCAREAGRVVTLGHRRAKR